MKKISPGWYFRTSFLIIAFLCVGPLALPLLWFNPRFSRMIKIVVTVIMIVLTYYLAVAAWKSWEILNTYYRQVMPQL